MFYQSVTNWDFDWRGSWGWMLSIRFGQFTTPTEAAKFGNSINLLHPFDADYLVLKDQEDQFFRIDDLAQVTIKKLYEPVAHRVESFHSYLAKENLDLLDYIFDDRLMTSDNDYEEISLTPDDIKNLPMSFGSLSYGVVDHEGIPVKIPPTVQEQLIINPLFEESIKILTAYCQTYFKSLQANLGDDQHVCASVYDLYPEGILVAIHLNYHYHEGIQVKPESELPTAIRDLLSNLDAALEGFFLICGTDSKIDDRPVANIYYLRSSPESRFSEQAARGDAWTVINLLESKAEKLSRDNH
jgi:hypothetical protein